MLFLLLPLLFLTSNFIEAAPKRDMNRLIIDASGLLYSTIRRKGFDPNEALESLDRHLEKYQENPTLRCFYDIMNKFVVSSSQNDKELFHQIKQIMIRFREEAGIDRFDLEKTSIDEYSNGYKQLKKAPESVPANQEMSKSSKYDLEMCVGRVSALSFTENQILSNNENEAAIKAAQNAIIEKIIEKENKGERISLLVQDIPGFSYAQQTAAGSLESLTNEDLTAEKIFQYFHKWFPLASCDNRFASFKSYMILLQSVTKKHPLDNFELLGFYLISKQAL